DRERQLEGDGLGRGREARQVVVEAEHATPDRADALEDPVAVEQAVVGDAHAGLGAVHDASVDPHLHASSSVTRGLITSAGPRPYPLRKKLQAAPTDRSYVPGHRAPRGARRRVH